MELVLTCSMWFIWLLCCQAEPSTFSKNVAIDTSRDGEGTNSSCYEPNDLKNSTAGNFQTSQNTSNQLSHLVLSETQNITSVGRPDLLSVSSNKSYPYLSSDVANTNNSYGVDVSTENVGTQNLSSDSSWMLVDSITNTGESNSTSSKPNQLEDNSTQWIVHYKIFREKDEQKDSVDHITSASHRLLALFLAMAGVLACLLILVYCIYNRQHKEDMFSHHRLYGEGFEDPVLHLDTPVDHFDFFAFRDTEITPTPTPEHKPQSIVNYENELESEPPIDKPSHEHLKQAIQMNTLYTT